jgi:hypothetical protein
VNFKKDDFIELNIFRNGYNKNPVGESTQRKE